MKQKRIVSLPFDKSFLIETLKVQAKNFGALRKVLDEDFQQQLEGKKRVTKK